MYLAHFHLKEKPFLLNTDPRFLWPGRKHKDALSLLISAAKENKGILLLTGEIGSGKTMLISALISMVDSRDVVVARLPDPGLERREFFFLTARGFGIKQRVFSRESFTEVMGHFLSRLDASGKRALLIIDEAQIMSSTILEEIRLLSNMEFQHKKLINIFLVGQNEFNIMLLEPKHRSIRERITATYNLELLSENETAAYISHRLKVAGAENEIFTKDALQEVHLFSNGSPRQINIICDMALMHGFNSAATEINRELIHDCKDKVRVPRLPGGPLADELMLDDESLREPVASMNQPDPVAFLTRTVRRLSWYGTLVLLLLLSGGYLLYSDWSRAYLLERMPFLAKILPAPSLSPHSRAGNVTASSILNDSPGDAGLNKPPVSERRTESHDMAIVPVQPDKKIENVTSSRGVDGSERRDKSETGPSSGDVRPGKSQQLTTDAPKTRADWSTKRQSRPPKAPDIIGTTGSGVRPAAPSAEPAVKETVSQRLPVVKKTGAIPTTADESSSSSEGTKAPDRQIPTDITTSVPDQPDPNDIIKWLLEEKDKAANPKRP